MRPLIYGELRRVQERSKFEMLEESHIAASVDTITLANVR